MTNPTAKTDQQTPGVYRRRIGDALVTTINDGFLDINFEILRGAGLDDFQGLMRAAFRDGPPRLTVNAFVIQTDRNTILSIRAAVRPPSIPWGGCRRTCAPRVSRPMTSTPCS